MTGRAAFLDLVLRNANNRAILERAGSLGLSDWWLTAGALFQTVWNGLEGRPAEQGILDYDLFYFDAADLTATSEARVNRDAAELFCDLGAVDHFAATTCCFAITRSDDGALEVYAPHGFADLLARRVRPNPVLAPRHVYMAKARRWSAQWPSLDVEAWPIATAGSSA